MTRQDATERELDLALAAQLQAALLPNSCPDCTHQVVAARNRMCAGVGGDFHDFIHLNDDQIAFVIGDVIGHGVRASLIMAQVMGFLRSAGDMLARPVDVIVALNRMMIDLGDKSDTVISCSVFYGVIDAPSGLGVFVNAGHPHPFICDRDKCSVMALHSHNMVLGVEEYEPTELCLTFVPGQRFVLRTDGIEDAVDEQNEHFGPLRLYDVICRRPDQDPDQLADAVFGAIDAFRGDAPQIDDETIVVIDRV